MRRLLVLALAIAGCAYDWDVGPRPTDAAIDSLAPDTAVVDSKPETVDCAALLAEVATRREIAKRCVSTAGVCTTTVTDECGCPSITAQPGADTNLYDQAAQRARSAACTSPACGPCQPTRKGFCLLADGGGTSCDGP